MSQDNKEDVVPLPIAILALIGVAALLCCGVITAWLLANIYPSLATNLSYSDENLELLGEALSARWDPDDSIPSATFGIEGPDTTYSPDAPWVAIELSYTEKCTETLEDPCEELADEFARIVLEQYTRVNDINGLQINITNHIAYGPVLAGTPNTHFGHVPLKAYTFERSPNYLVKSMTIERWREELSTERGQPSNAGI